MNRLLAAALLFTSLTAHANPPPPHPTEPAVTWGYEGYEQHYTEEDASHRLTVGRDPFGRTRIKVLAPEGATLHVLSEGREIYSDEVPTLFDAQPGVHYRINVVLPDGRMWSKHVETRPGAIARLWVHGPSEAEPARAMPPPPPPPPPGPQPMEANRFQGLRAAIGNEAFPNGQLAVLKTAAEREFFTCAQVASVVDLLSFPHDKVEAVHLMRPHVLDPQNAYTLAAHFDFPNDKETVQRMFR